MCIIEMKKGKIHEQVYRHFYKINFDLNPSHNMLSKTPTIFNKYEQKNRHFKSFTTGYLYRNQSIDEQSKSIDCFLYGTSTIKELNANEESDTDLLTLGIMLAYMHGYGNNATNAKCHN